MKIRIHSIYIEGYKSIRDGKFIFNDRNIISGRHGSGKSSIAYIIYFLFCKDDELHKILNLEKNIKGPYFKTSILRMFRGFSRNGFYIKYVFSINGIMYSIRRCFDGKKIYYEESKVKSTINIVTNYNTVLDAISKVNTDILYFLLLEPLDIFNKKNIHIIFDKDKYYETFRIQSGIEDIDRKYNVSIDNINKTKKIIMSIIRGQVIKLKNINKKIVTISNRAKNINNLFTDKYKDASTSLRAERDIIVSSLDHELIPMHKKIKDGTFYDIFLYNKVKTFVDTFNKISLNYKISVTHNDKNTVFLLNGIQIKDISSYEMAILRVIIKFSIVEMFNYDIIFIDDRYFSSFNDFNFCEIPDSQVFICETSESGLFIK